MCIIRVLLTHLLNSNVFFALTKSCKRSCEANLSILAYNTKGRSGDKVCLYYSIAVFLSNLSSFS
jgi:hypothetical protein